MEYGFSLVAVDHDNSPASSQDSLYSSHTKVTSSSYPKRRRRSIQKRVVSVPIKEIEGSRLKGGDTPSDSWAWRKYGQKPIKGSPYPRGYYRCSSSKGCPTRKQVERSRADPGMVMVTYSCDHNHRRTASGNNNHNSSVSPQTAEESLSHPDDQEEDPPLTSQLLAEHKEKFTGLEVCPSGASFVTTADPFGWFSELESQLSTMLEIPLMVGNIVEDADMAMIFSIREEDDELLFADLGELPECTTVFRRSTEIINDRRQAPTETL